MRYSKLFGKTEKEIPHDATVVSHQMLIRGGFVYQIAAGIYDFLPLGFRVLMNLDRIIKEELSKKDIQHLLMPFVHPASLWQETGRYDKMDKILAKFKSKRGSDHVLAPTHEETITDLARHFVHTYRDMPVTLNQNQWKYRDETRVNGGLLRTREFLMQDAYSFDANQEDLGKSFDTVSEAYHAIFKRIGLPIHVVKADSGTMGGSDSQEFMLVADVGEDSIFLCDSCDYKANMEKAESRVKAVAQDTDMKPMEAIESPGIVGVEQLAEFLKVDVAHTTKTMLFQADDTVVAVMIRGDYDINETKLTNYLSCKDLALASAETIKRVTGAEVGYAGPVGLPADVKVVADLTCEGRVNFEAGANKTNYHNINVNFERDFPTPPFVDLRAVKENDACPWCEKGHLEKKNAVELGHVFKLGTCYSEQMKAYFTDKDGQQKPVVMGCYGIGISRLIGAIAETCHDEKGVIWPKAVSPFDVHLVHLGKDASVVAEAEKLYENLRAKHIEVLYDDRDDSPGVKFNDADLIGIPLRLVVSSRSLEKGGVEWKMRSEKDAKIVAMADVLKETVQFCES